MSKINSVLNQSITVIVPCYKQAHFLDACLESIYSQTNQNWECIVVNDGSPDDTKTVASKWLEKDSRFKYMEKENGGLSSARNAGLDKATGDYIQFLDADDCLHPLKFETSLLEFEAQAADLVVTNFNLFESLDQLLPPYCKLHQELLTFENILYQWDNGFSIPIHCGLFKASLFDAFRFPEHIKAKEDWIMWVTLFKLQPKASYIDRPMAFYRKNPESMVRSNHMDIGSQYINAVAFLKSVLDTEIYEHLLFVLFERYYKRYKTNSKELMELKKNFAYRLMRKISKKLGLDKN